MKPWLVICLALAFAGRADAALEPVAHPSEQNDPEVARRPPMTPTAPPAMGFICSQQGEYGRAMHVFQLQGAGR